MTERWKKKLRPVAVSRERFVIEKLKEDLQQGVERPDNYYTIEEIEMLKHLPKNYVYVMEINQSGEIKKYKRFDPDIDNLPRIFNIDKKIWVMSAKSFEECEELFEEVVYK